MSATLSFHFNFPASTSMATQTAVIAFVVEAQIDIVDVSNAVDFPNSVLPYPFLKTTFPSFTTATDKPGTFHKGIASCMYLSKMAACEGSNEDFFAEFDWAEEQVIMKRRSPDKANDLIKLVL
jgi:hypothetical protein